ncbi:MAG TPA: YceI family protein [Gemmatimonadales bacterium]|jgi:polyisoprenoid-binding protein YceI
MAPLHLLVLERDPTRREELVSLLRGAGHRPAVAPDAPAAAMAIGVPGFDTLVLDLSFPDVDLGLLRQSLAPSDVGEPDSLAAAERRHIARALRHTDGNKRRAAMLLGISRSTLLNKVRKYGLVVALALCGMPGPALALQGSPIPAGQVKAGTLSFDGHATPGDFVGKTSEVSGEMAAADSLTAVRGWVKAPVKTLKTENDRRDRDLNKSMESDKYAEMRFDLKGVSVKSGGPDSAKVDLHGTLTIHGVTRDVTLPASVSLGAGEVHVQSDFPLNLKDYKIGGLTKALGILKMEERIEVHVNLTFAPQ